MILETLLSFINVVLPFLIILTVLVFVHELGHYLIARFNGVKVETFSIGFGKELFGINDKKGTRWKFSLIPLGGYVKMHGDEDAASSKQKKESEIDPNISFYKKSVGQRSAILFAGPAANYIFSFILLIFINIFYGSPVVKPIVSELVIDGPAMQAGVKEKDLVLSVNKKQIESFEELRQIIQKENNKFINLTISRNNKVFDLNIFVKDKKIGIKGLEKDLKKLNFFESINHSAYQIYFFTVSTINGIIEIFKGERNTDELGGPIRIAELSADFWSKGVHSTLWFMVLISLNLGLINLFPIPLLDGGHLLFNFVEFIKGSPIDKKTLELLHSIGFFVLISLMLFATYNDISRFFI